MRWGATVSVVVTRSVACGLGLAAIIWALYTLPIFWRQSNIEQTAKHIIAGDSFKAGILGALDISLPAVSDKKWDRSSALSSLATIQLRFLEQAIIDGNTKAIDMRMGELQPAIRRSLENAPADPFLWVVLFWLDNTQKGFKKAHLEYLRMSYLVGPNEGWVGIRRNRFALALFSQLPSDLAEDAIGEFVRLVDSRFFSDALNILVGPGWPIRNSLLPRLKDASELSRQLFAKIIFRMGYDVSVPGIERPEFRPWQ